jgi:multidrug resistance efflux pump
MRIMSEDPPLEQSAGGPEPGTEKALYLDQSLWHQFADAETIEAFAQSWLGLQALMIGGVSSGVVVLMSPESRKLSPVALWPQGFREGSRFNAVLERALKEGKGVVLRNDTDVELENAEDLRFLLAYPVTSRDELHGVAVVEIFPREQIELQAAMRKLQWGISWLQNWILRSATEPGERSTQRLQTVMEITALALEEDSFQSAATAVVTELATRLRCDRVSVGFVDGTQVHVRALSHSAQFGKEMNLIRSIGAAMGESVDQQATLLYPEPEGSIHPILQAHSQLARAHGDSAICTIPFVDQEQRSFGALMLERAVPEPFDEDTVELCDSLAALVGPILEDKRKNDRILVVKIRDSLWSQVQKLIGPRYSGRKVFSVLLLALVLFFCFANGQYRVTAKTTLEGEIQRVIVAPFRGFISEAPVRAGEIVKQDQLLCRLDDRDLHLEYSRWASEREQYVLEHRRAMAESDLPAMNVLGKKMGQVDAQLALLDEQISHAEIVAPFDGVVVSGDLSQSLGAPVEQGQSLFEVAPLDAYRVMLQVDEREIRQIREGQTGKLVLAAMPDVKLSFSVVSITPVSVTEEGGNFFRVEARLDQVSERLRPGMVGFGKIEIERRKLIWIWVHEMIDWFRLKSWSWLP